MACIIQDLVLNFDSTNAPIPVPLVSIYAEPATTPLFLSSSSLFHEQSFTKRSTATDVNGQWQFTLPWPSEQDPAITKWIITLPDGSRWMGNVPQGVAGPISLYTLKNSYGWGLISATNQNLIPVAIQGPLPLAFRYMVTGSEGEDFRVNLPIVLGTTSYAVTYGVISSTVQATVMIPNGTGDRTTTDFRVFTSVQLAAGDAIEFMVVTL